MKHFLFASLAVAFAISSFSQSKKAFEYTVDLTSVKDDKVLVTLRVPKIKTPETVFYMPKMIPGTYAIADYGRFVSDFKALDSKGRELVTEKLTENSWKIKTAGKLATITYWVGDSYDNPPAGPSIYPMAGTNIEDGKNFVLNAAGFFGYLEDQKKTNFNIRVVRPEHFYASTGLIPNESGRRLSKVELEAGKAMPKLEDLFSLESYDHLIDSPIMYSKPDTAVIRVGNAEVLIGLYSPNSKINAHEVASTIKDILIAQQEYLGGTLPVNKYAFILYFTDQPAPGYGALEHSYSSFYYLPERTIEQMKQQLRGVAAHEFFHIITPLTIHSEEIENFDFNDPKMSKHLWLYEGMTEYFAGNVQVRSGIISGEQYLELIRGKMNTSQAAYKDDLPFTELSSKALGEHVSQYGNVYQKGALIGMCLDIQLRKYSNGGYGARNMILDLSKKYGKNAAFNDNDLFAEITKMTYPEIGDFFKKYVEGSEKLPYAEVFNLVGVGYIPEEKYRDVSNGLELTALTYAKVPEKDNKPFLVINNPDGLNEQGKAIGFQKGDVIISINGEAIPNFGITGFLAKQKETLSPGKTLTYQVFRKDASGTLTEQTLSAQVFEIDRVRTNILSFNPNATSEQLALRKAWLER